MSTNENNQIEQNELEDLDLEESIKDIKYSELSRRDIRSLIFHILYAYDAFDYDSSVDAIVDNLNRGYELDIPLNSEVVIVSSKIITSKEELDKVIGQFLANWRMERLGVSTRLILRIGVWELLNTDVPSTVVINEAYKFINGILDEVAKKLTELKQN
jgi:transcription antitermination protein NusB